MTSKRLGVVAAALLVAACGTATPATQAPDRGQPAASGSTASGDTLDNLRVFPSLAPETAATLLAAAQAELETRRRLRDEAGIAEALGESGAAILLADAEAETAFGEQGLAELASTFQLDLTTARLRGLTASIRDVPMPRIDPAADWSGSLIGATSFTISMYMGFAPQLFPQASDKEFRTQEINRNEPHDIESNGVREHLVLDQKLTVGVGGGRVQMDITLTSTSIITSIATGTEIARRSSVSTGHFELNGCPGADGSSLGKYLLVNQEEVTRSVGSNGGASKTEGPFTVFNGDDAHLIRTDFTASVAAGAHGPATSGGDPFDWGVTATFPVSIPAQGGVTAISVGDPASSSEHNVTPRNTTGLSSMLLLAGHYLGDAAKEAERFWRSGACIDMKTSVESKQVNPTATVQFTVDPEHKFEGGKVTAQVKASFSGKQQLTPTDRPQDPPASYTFSAGNQIGDKGTIQLEQVGKRGIGKKTLEFTVGISDYKVDISALGFGFITGIKCNGREGQWILSSSGSGTNGTIKFLFAPGQDGTEAHAVYDISGGEATVHWDLLGVVTFIDTDPPLLRFGKMSGTATVKAGGQTITTPTEQLAFDAPLQTGKFCT